MSEGRNKMMTNGGGNRTGSFSRKLKGDWFKTKLCTACVSPLGRILSRGGHCPQCGLRVCKNCRYYVGDAGGNNKGNEENVGGNGGPGQQVNWICVLCSGAGPPKPTLEQVPKGILIKPGSKSIRRSWTISNPQQGHQQTTDSPVLKSYVTYNDDNRLDQIGINTRQFNSLPRLTYGIKEAISPNQTEDRRVSYSTLYPFNNNKANSTTSVNFIEDPFWDYYDYNNIINNNTNSNRSSCERSLGDTEYCSYIIDPENGRRVESTISASSSPRIVHCIEKRSPDSPVRSPPRKPDRPSKRSNSLNSYDGRHMMSYSPLRTYVVLRDSPSPAAPADINNKKVIGAGGGKQQQQRRSASFNVSRDIGKTTPFRENHVNNGSIHSEHQHENSAPPPITTSKPKRLFVNQENTPTTTPPSSVIEQVYAKRAAAAVVREGSRESWWKNNQDQYQDKLKNHHEQEFSHVQPVRVYCSQSLPRTKPKVMLTSQPGFYQDDSGFSPTPPQQRQHSKIVRSVSDQGRPEDQFLSSPIPKPPRKSITGSGINGPPLPQPHIYDYCTIPRNMTLKPTAGSINVIVGGEPEIDPKLQELLRKSEKILNTTITTSSLINSPPTIEGNVNIVQINSTPQQVHTFPRRGKLGSSPPSYNASATEDWILANFKHNFDPSNSCSTGAVNVNGRAEEDERRRIEEKESLKINQQQEKQQERESRGVTPLESRKDARDQLAHLSQVIKDEDNNGKRYAAAKEQECHNHLEESSQVWKYSQGGFKPIEQDVAADYEEKGNGWREDHQVRTAISNKLNASNSSCSSRLTDPNNRQQYGLTELIKTRETAGAGETGDQYNDSHHPRKLRIIRGRPSNEFVTTVQISNDSFEDSCAGIDVTNTSDTDPITADTSRSDITVEPEILIRVIATSEETRDDKEKAQERSNKEKLPQGHLGEIGETAQVQQLPSLVCDFPQAWKRHDFPSSTSDTTDSADTIIDFLGASDNTEFITTTEVNLGPKSSRRDDQAESTGDRNISEIQVRTLNGEQPPHNELEQVNRKAATTDLNHVHGLIAHEEEGAKSSDAKATTVTSSDEENTIRASCDDDKFATTTDSVGIVEEKPPSHEPVVINSTDSVEDVIEDDTVEAPTFENLSDIYSGGPIVIKNESLLEYLHSLTQIQPESSTCGETADQKSEVFKEDIKEDLSDHGPAETAWTDEDAAEGSASAKHTIVMDNHERLTPEGQESFTDDASSTPSTTKRSSPDGEAIQDVKFCKRVEVPYSDSDSDNSWIEEMPYEDEGPPPLDRTLHTIVEESCEESDEGGEVTEPRARFSTGRRRGTDELENYFNFLDPAQSQNASNRKYMNEDSEFSDTFSESSFSTESQGHDGEQGEDLSMDPVDLASTRLEKYFTNMSYGGGNVKQSMAPQSEIVVRRHSVEQDSEDSVGSESECDDRMQDKKKKVLKHKRTENVSDDESVFDLDEGAYDTIKKSRKSKKETLEVEVPELSRDDAKTPTPEDQPVEVDTDQVSSPIRKQVLLNRSNSFQWSSDEEVNLMMSKLRQLVKGLMNKGQGRTPTEANSQQLRYFETELVRLMRTEPELKTIVSEYISSAEESDDSEFNQFMKEVVSQDAPDSGVYGTSHELNNRFSSKAPPGGSGGSPALIAKVMNHIGSRLSVWMKDEEEAEGTLKCAPSVSSDLNEDRFSWKGSFESTLAAKRQSVGSTDSISSSDYNNQLSQGAGSGSGGVDRSILRSSSLHHLANTHPIEEKKEEEENISSSLPRLNQVQIPRAQSLLVVSNNKEKIVKSARYRPPGFAETPRTIKQINDKIPLSISTPALNHDINQESSSLNLRVSDSLANMYESSQSSVNVRGQIEFGLQYNYKLASLEVRVKQCRDLAAADNKRNRSDPYVKAYLLPDRSRGGKRKTKTKKNTFNPIFEETLKFPITLSDLQSRTLWITVWHSDMFGKNHFLGQVLIPLRDRVFDEPSAVWWTLEEMTDQTDGRPRGDIVIALKWQTRTDSTGNLSVLVKEAKNLLPAKNGLPSTFVKCCPLKDSRHRSKQKTSIARRTNHPIWNQTLYFEDVSDDGIEISLWNYDLLSNHDLIGIIRLDQDAHLWESMLNRPSFWVEGILKLEAEPSS